MLEGTHVPLDALCTDEGWNGFHVPLLSCAELNEYMAACEQNDRNGEWSERAWEQATPAPSGSAGLRLRMPYWGDPTNRDLDDVWAPNSARTHNEPTYAIDGWVWVDYSED